MTSLDALFEKLWKDYSAMNKQADVIHKVLEKRGEKIVNDHVAFRTFSLPKVTIDVMAKPFLERGYREASGEGYHFKEKKLFAKHFEHPDPKQPKVFISELKVQECSAFIQKTVKSLVEQVPSALAGKDDFLISGTLGKKVDFKTYQELLKESEYAAWMSAFGFRVNHFTIFYNELKTFESFSELNRFVKDLGFPLNQVGGEVKGNPQVFLEQSSTLAHPLLVEFADCSETIPACYYEFAKRYKMPNGKLFQGFLPDSADKIFESTHRRP